MKLEFDSIAELEQFLMFSAHVGAAFVSAPDKATVSDNGASSEIASHSNASDQAGNDDGASDAPSSPDKPKRTRRTKEPIKVIQEEPTKTAPVSAPGLNPFSVPVTPSVETDVHFTAHNAVDAPRVVESIEHLRACQRFIQQYGMAKYNETFRDGLNANIAVYTPEQRVKHMTILESFLTEPPLPY